MMIACGKQKWYDAANKRMPVLRPGSDMRLNVQITADHGGQAWMMIACGTEISEEVNWTILERSASDRGHHFLPQHPGMYPWIHGGVRSSYHVPSYFSCPSELAVGRWVWKTGHWCNDADDRGRVKTEPFDMSVAPNLFTGYRQCTTNSEVFISCFDFKGTWTPQPTPAPAPTPQPTPAPPPGPCRHQTDCNVSPWCNAGLDSWCRSQGAAGVCPNPQCTRAEVASFLRRLRG